MKDRLLFVDTETGGLDPNRHSLLSLGMVVWDNMEIIDSDELLINDGKLSVTEEALLINKIDIEKHKKNAISSSQAIGKIKIFLQKNFRNDKKIILAGHNINFDVNFIRSFFSQNNESFGKFFSHRFIDTSSILYYLYLTGHIKYKTISSNDAFNFFGIKVTDRHTALGDAIATAKLFTNLVHITNKKFKEENTIISSQLDLFQP